MRFRKTLTLFMLVMGLAFALSAWAQQKPFTRDQVQGLVRDGLGDESGAKLIEQRGIDFAPVEDFLQSLKAAGASEVFLKALRGPSRLTTSGCYWGIGNEKIPRSGRRQAWPFAGFPRPVPAKPASASSF